MAADPIVENMTPQQLRKTIENTRRLMQEAAKRLDFLEAAQYRDELLRLMELDPSSRPPEGESPS